MLERLNTGAEMPTEWAGRSIAYYREIDSTNRAAREMARNGAAHGTLVLADMQTSGRGRRGRSWISPAGEGVFMTLIIRPQESPEKAARISLAAALAAARGIARVSGLDARIKWPNDIVIGGRKVCGMLLEMDLLEGGLPAVSAGIGVNVHQTQFDEEIAHTASSLDLLAGRRIDRADVVLAILKEMERAMRELQADEAAFMRAYRAMSATLGQRVQVIAHGESYTGVAQAVTQGGSLLVRADEDGALREVLAADVSVRGIMGYV
ncbi:MAG: biotin--[Clostridia bacterium]|nr:biotin--[acetyl-CoA-carboxylase] ligase [Clostridia bacterium]